MSFIPTRIGLRGKLMAGSAVLLAFTGVTGALAIKDVNTVADRTDAVYTASVVKLGELSASRAAFADGLVANVKTGDSRLDGQIAAYAANPAQATDRQADAIDARFETLIAATVRAGKAANEQSAAAAAGTVQRTLLLLAIALIVGLATAFWFSGRMLKPIKEILDRLTMLRDHCATDLAQALDRVARGDLTVAVVPVTPELHRSSGDEIGDIAEAVGSIRNSTVQSVLAYNEMRAQLADTMSELSEQAQTVAAASQQMAATSDDTGRAVSEIAAAVTEVAHGAERQVRCVEATREAVQEAARTARDQLRRRRPDRAGRRRRARRRPRGCQRRRVRFGRDA